MKILYYDCFAGISGDMNLGALVDLGVPEEHLRAELNKLGLEDEFSLVVEKKLKNGIMGTKVDVVLTPPSATRPPSPASSAKKKSLSLHKGTQTGKLLVPIDSHAHRNLGHIEALIMHSGLSEAVKALSFEIFMHVAKAEALVHGKPIDEVHFHEVGAIDSIIDIVGAAICIEALQVDQIISSPIQLGGGFVKCDHGLIPVPAPATVQILKGLPVKLGLVDKEMTTPTGAAILATVVQSFTDKIDFMVDKIGYGLGTRELAFPNVLRVYLGHTETPEIKEQQMMIEVNIDDMSPEWFGLVEEKLFEAGALDVYKTAILMKKGRSAVMLSVLVSPANEDTVLEILFKHTTTFGVRKTRVDKIMLQRKFEKLMTPYGEVTIKAAYYQGRIIKYKPEFEDCKALALKANINLDTLYRAITRQMEGQIEQ